MNESASFFFARALLGTTVATNVRLTVDASGNIDTLSQNTSPEASDTRLPIGLPGMPNLHSHAHQAALAGHAERRGDTDDTFWTWREAMYRFALRMTPEQFEAIATALYVAMLKGGYTSVGEFHYLHHDQDGAPYSDRSLMSQCVLSAAQRAGIAATVLPVLYRYGDFGDASTTRSQRRFVCDVDAYLKLLEDVASAARDQANARVGLAPHSLRAVSADVLRSALANSPLADDAPVHIHIAEQVGEVQAAVRVLAQRPVAYLLQHFDVNARWCLIHATHMTDEETDALAGTGAVVGLCPSTEANLGDGLFPARRYLAAGGRFGVGSDSNLITDAAEELRWLEYGQRLAHRERNVLAPRGQIGTGAVLLARAVHGGAQALAQPCNGLAVGQRADFIVLDDTHRALVGRNDNALDAFVFCAGASSVRDVYVAGKPVITDGHHQHDDDIERRARHALEELAP